MTGLETRVGRHIAEFAGAIAALVVLGVGVPVALVHLAGNPLPGTLPDLGQVLSTLTGRDDGTLFLRALAVVGWLAWASFALSVALEVGARLSRRGAPVLPGLRAQQRLASVLIGVILSGGASAGFASSDAAPAMPVAAVEVSPPAVDAPAASVLHLVARGEALLDLQDRYGVSWQRIAEANYEVRQPDGRSLQRGQTRIYPGWQLRIPTGHDDTAPPPQQRQRLVHTVAAGDWLWHIADRYLGDPQRYAEIAALNPEYAERASGDGTLLFPDYLEPGWVLRLPPDAADRGAAPHATGTASTTGPVAEPAPAPELAEPVPDPDPTPPPVPEPEPEPEPEPDAESLPTAPPIPDTSVNGAEGEGGYTGPADTQAEAEATATESVHVDGDTDDDALAGGELERLLPAGLAGAGLLAALVLGLRAAHRRRRRQQHQPGMVLTAASQRLEHMLHVAQQPVEVERLDAALRALASGLTDRVGDLPDVAGALLDDGVVEVMLGRPAPSPPVPWRERGDRWLLPAEVELPAPERVLAPLPALVAVGSQAGRHVLLDLERLGVLTVHGDRDRSMLLLRYLAAELACNTWSDSVDVLLAGFDPADAASLASLRPERVHVLTSVAEGVRLLRRRVAAAQDTLRHAGAADSFAGRVLGLAGDAWMPQVLLAAHPSEPERHTLAELQRELAATGRCAVAAVTTGDYPAQAGNWRVTVNADGAIHLRLPFLHGCLAAAGLTRQELAAMADEVRHAQVGPPVPMAEMVAEPAPPVDPAADAYLDTDLAAWHADDPGRPRIGVLGPVRIDAPGVPPEQRQRLHAELVVYLAQRAEHGADAESLREALWPGQHIRDADWQLVMARCRRWLGVDAAGEPWLAEVGAGMTYRLADGYLLDWDLFQRLRRRGESTQDPAMLRSALMLVRGVPLHRASRATGPGTRNPFPWLAGSPIDPEYLVAAVVDTAHLLAEHCLADGDTDGVRWAVQQAWLADADRSYDQPWRDLLVAEHADGAAEQLNTVVAELMEVRDAEAPEDLSPDTYTLVRDLLPGSLAGS